MLPDTGRPGQPNLFDGRPQAPPPIDPPPPVRFFSIESADPPAEFWHALARLLDTLRAAALRKGR